MRKEPTLLTSAPVVAGGLYVVDGKVVISTVTGTVATLKASISGSTTVRAIDVPGRRMQTSAKGEQLFDDP